MSEDGEMWQAIKEERRKKRWSNLEQSLKALQRVGISYQVLNADIGHYRIGDYDFWPSTGKFINRKTKYTGRGVFNLIKRIK